MIKITYNKKRVDYIIDAFFLIIFSKFFKKLLFVFTSIFKEQDVEMKFIHIPGVCEMVGRRDVRSRDAACHVRT